ncbi:hypothetical protein DFH09DRAFT_1073193 [Mycena vulgaris]|nr:hypothetical protein DFH09DRAFT_1073193 [Mycena vulgaris]
MPFVADQIVLGSYSLDRPFALLGFTLSRKTTRSRCRPTSVHPTNTRAAYDCEEEDISISVRSKDWITQKRKGDTEEDSASRRSDMWTSHPATTRPTPSTYTPRLDTSTQQHLPPTSIARERRLDSTATPPPRRDAAPQRGSDAAKTSRLDASTPSLKPSHRSQRCAPRGDDAALGLEKVLEAAEVVDRGRGARGRAAETCAEKSTISTPILAVMPTTAVRYYSGSFDHEQLRVLCSGPSMRREGEGKMEAGWKDGEVERKKTYGRPSTGGGAMMSRFWSSSSGYFASRERAEEEGEHKKHTRGYPDM